MTQSATPRTDEAIIYLPHWSNGEPIPYVPVHVSAALELAFYAERRRCEELQTELSAAKREERERCAKVCDAKANEARATWDKYVASCRKNPDNIGAGSQSWHHYYESCAQAIRELGEGS